MPWAITDEVSTDPMLGGIEITFEQYLAAIDAMTDGKRVVLENGVMTFQDPAPLTQPINGQ
jgi:hypothetical protein